MNSASDVWLKVLELIGADLTSTAVDTWFSDSRAIDISDGCLVVCTPTDFKKDVIVSRFSDTIKTALKELFSGDFDFMVLSQKELDEYEAEQRSPGMESDVFTFERFVVGNSNKFAHAAAKAVAENPAGVYNPLFIYGQSGLGKTHLLYAIGNVVRKNTPEAKIVYIKGDDFTNELISAIQTGKNKEFREKYRMADLFLVDYIQFIAGKIQTQEEFFHTFNTLYESGRQIVLTSDRPPMEILRLEDRLKSRFEWGLLADIQPPDYETRVAIVKNKAQQLGLIISDEISDCIAERVTSNVRQLEGVVNKLMAYNELLDDDIDLAKVKQIIDVIIKERGLLPTPDEIIEETAQYYRLTAQDLKGQNRTKNNAMARQIAMYLIRKQLNMPLSDIGKEFEGRDHTTVLSSIKKIESMMQRSQEFTDTIKDISANINARN